MSRDTARLQEMTGATDAAAGESRHDIAGRATRPITVGVASCHHVELLGRCLEAILAEVAGVDDADVVVARSEEFDDLEALQEKYPMVKFVAGPRDANVPLLRGLALAQISEGDALLTEDHCIVEPGWLEAFRARLLEGADIVGGPMANATEAGALDWGAYYSEYGFFGPLADERGVPSPTGANVAYAQTVLPSVAESYREGHWENVIHDALRRANVRLSFAKGAQVRQADQYRWTRFCRDRFEHGFAYSRKRLTRAGLVARFGHALKTPLLTPVLLVRVWRAAGRASPGQFVRSLPFTTSFLGAWVFGELIGCFAPSLPRHVERGEDFSELGGDLARLRAKDFPPISLSSRISVVIPSVNGWHDLGDCLDAVLSQSGDVDVEVLVVDRVGEEVRKRLVDESRVRLIEAAPGTTIPDLRATAFELATGAIVGVIEDHVIVPPDWAERMLREHAAGSLVVGGSVDNAARENIVEWASFLCEYSHCLTPPSGFAEWLTGNNVTYRRQLLEEYEGVISEGGWENRLHDALRVDGIPLLSNPEIEVGHKKHFGFFEYLSQRYLYSRSYAGAMVAGTGVGGRLFRVALSAALPPVLGWRIVSNIWQSGRYRGKLVASLPMISAFVVSWAIGEAVGSAFGAGDALGRVR